MRFPELFRDYAQNDLDLILMPSNFMEETGKAHWEVLCRARAIENQCYVLAPAQCGEIPHLKLESWGHSLILDPWGTIVSKAYRKPCVLKYQLDKKKIYAFRTKLPSLKNRAFNISLKLV